jgi:predicted nucleotidyltransferase component of viral defense system
MGQKSILSQKQQIILKEFKESSLSSSFYFTGGTALSEYYLKHRVSVDLDFFSEKEFDPQIVLNIVSNWSKKYNLVVKSEYLDPTHIYFLTFKDEEEIKVDFARYPYPHLNKPENSCGIIVDSFYDISVNKFLLVNQRTEVKDFVDLFYILKKYNFWQLKDGVEAKFNIEIDPYLMSVDFMKANDFQIMPQMLKKLNLNELKDFFQEQAKKLGLKSVR